MPSWWRTLIIFYTVFLFRRFSLRWIPTLFPYTTLFRSLAVGIDPGEALEDAPLILRRDPDPLVLDPDVDLGIAPEDKRRILDRKSTRLNSSHVAISYAVFCLKKKKRDHCRF